MDNNELSQEYQNLRPIYGSLALAIKSILESVIDKKIVHKIESRSKDVEKFIEKSKNTIKITDRSGNLQDKLKYSDPIKQITDLAGVRVITFTQDSIEIVKSIVKSEGFIISDPEDVGERVWKQGRLGYQSYHMILEFGENRLRSGEYKPFANLKFELQIRTILQHAWAELEHDLQYKAGFQLPPNLQKRFSALAGLIHIADREFESIIKEDSIIKDFVANSAIDDLTMISLSSQSDITNINIDSKNVRDLMKDKKYNEAINIYSSKINITPTAGPIYLGRAKAYFLIGEIELALADVALAEKYAPNSPGLPMLKVAIETGDTISLSVPRKRAGDSPEGLAIAKEYLEDGKGFEAFETYSQLEDNGYSPAFSNLGKSMSCILESDVNGSKNYLTRLTIRPMTAMAINIEILNYIISCRENLPGDAPDEQRLAQAVQDFPNFSLSSSQVSWVISGMRTKSLLDERANNRLNAILRV